MQTEIKKILDHAVFAPSGDNSQPWEFHTEGASLDLINLPRRDNPIFNFEQRGSYIAHGAVIENIALLAPLYGLKTEITLFPQEGKNIIAKINFIAGASISQDKSLISIIKARTTNRKKYQKKNLDPNQREKILNDAQNLQSGQLLLLEDPLEIKKIAEAASMAEQAMLQHKPLHDAFFSMIRWNPEEESQKKFGLLIDTLELLPPQKLIFKWFSNWRASAVLRKIGLPKFIGRENSKTYASSSAIGAIVAKDDTPKSFVNTGRLLQKIWLTATELNLSVQPLAGVLYLGQRLEKEGMPDLQPTLQNELKNAVKQIYQTFKNPSGIITMLFRIGKSGAPSAHSIKKPPTYK